MSLGLSLLKKLLFSAIEQKGGGVPLLGQRNLWLLGVRERDDHAGGELVGLQPDSVAGNLLHGLART